MRRRTGTDRARPRAARRVRRRLSPLSPALPDAEGAPMTNYGLYIDGADVAAASGETFEALNPTTGRRWATHALASDADVDRAVRAAAAAFESEAWRALSPTRRGRLMMR